MKVIIVIGTTGGHIYPGVSLADSLKQGSHEVVLVTRADCIADKILEGSDYNIEYITGEGLKRKLSLGIFRFLFKLVKGFFQALVLIKRFRPDIIIGMGGYLTPPFIISAGLCRIPSIIHEQNVLPGLSIKVLSKFASRVAVSFEKTGEYLHSKNIVVTGNPVRQEILNCTREEGERYLKLTGRGINLLVFGGSQGAESINRAMMNALKFLAPLKESIRIIHITGPGNFSGLLTEYKKNDYNSYVMPYLQRMENAYACADIVVSRAGATTIAELIAKSVPGILVPYPFATANHQLENAKVIAGAGGGIIIENSKLTGELLADTLLEIIRDNKIDDMRVGIRKLYQNPDTSSFEELIGALVEK